MNKTQKLITGIALAAFVTTLAFAPWEVATKDGKQTFYPHGPLWSGPKPGAVEEPESWYGSSHGVGSKSWVGTNRMNNLVRWWRSTTNDARSDDEITLDLAGQFPDEFQTYKDALADFDRIRKVLSQQIEEHAAAQAKYDYFVSFKNGAFNVSVRYGMLATWWFAIGVLFAGGLSATRTRRDL